MPEPTSAQESLQAQSDAITQAFEDTKISAIKPASPVLANKTAEPVDEQMQAMLFKAEPAKAIPLIPLPLAQTSKGQEVKAVSGMKATIEEPKIKTTQKQVDRNIMSEKVHPLLGKNTAGCAALTIILILIFIALLGYVLAKTGLLRVPFFWRYYNAPTPVRVINVQPISWEAFQQMITERVRKMSATSNPPYTLVVSEGDLTSLMNGVVVQGIRSSAYKVDQAQVAVTKNNIELFFRLIWAGVGNMDFLVHLKPVVAEDSVMHFEVLDAKVGDLPLPTPFVIQILEQIFSRDLGVWRILVGQEAGINDVFLFDQSMHVILGPVKYNNN